MQSASVSAALPSTSSCYCHPLRFRDLKRNPSSLSFSRNQIHAKSFCSLTLSTANIFCKEEEEENLIIKASKSNPDRNHAFFEQFYYSCDINKVSRQYSEAQNQEQEEDDEEEEPRYKANYREVLFTNMVWAELKAALGQRINFEGIVSSAFVFVKDRHLAIPHVSVPDIRYIDWAELRRRGFKGVVFDKDNTLTAPYSLTLWDPLSSSIEQCKSVFNQDIAVFSNSAGLYEYDLDASKARKLEGKIGIKVIRHGVKKPAGTAEEIEKHFGCQSSQLIMVGDRPFTDIVYGNRNGLLTILTEPFSLAEEPFIVRQVRKLEVTLVNRWSRRGLKPVSHNLLPDATLCVKDPPHL